MTVEKLHIELQRRGKIPAGTTKPDLQEVLIKTIAEPPTVRTTSPVVLSDPIDEDSLHVRMSRFTAGSTDTQLELHRLEMEERRMIMDLEAWKLEFEDRQRQQELHAEDRGPRILWMDFDLNMRTSAELHAMNRNDVKPIRFVRKAICSLRLWLPARQRAHSRSTTVELLILTGMMHGPMTLRLAA